MTEPSLPNAAELILPTLKAAHSVGGKARYEVIDAAAVEIAGITPDQVAVEFPPESSQRGPKVLLQVAWARSILKRIGALDSVGGGVWTITDTGVDYLAMEDEEATSALRSAVANAYGSREPEPSELLALREAAESGKPEAMAVRDLIAMWGAGRRWSSINDRIIRALDDHGLRTEPDFTIGSLDQVVSFVLLSPDAEPVSKDRLAVQVTLTVGNLPSASGGVVHVKPNDDLLKAQTLMWSNDYSQLAVMTSKRGLEGAVSWESIGRARLRNPDAVLRDCIIDPAVVRLETPLLEAVSTIASAEFVFVRAHDAAICGIVTTADLSDQFVALARPFLMLGEIEQLFRTALDHTFTSEQLSEAVDPSDDRVVEGAHSLSLGEVQRFIEEPDKWDRLGWPVDRRSFVQALNDVRVTRNEIMHFSPDPLDDRRLTSLETFLAMLRDLVAP